ncbi:MAG TPA: lipopolysaccharide transport periplasmic protein LptA [Burkholderiaceae bacterium]|nr:lipopolysaccharide transport periplasmic protein LptA [Burkholderiaceae bacterium]
MRAIAAGLAVALGAGLGLVALPVQAERADRGQPMQFDAGQMRIDGKRKVQLLTGGVELNQGTMQIRAAQVELRETPRGQVAVAEGSANAPLVQFRQKRDGVDEWIEGQAERVEYDAGSQVVRLFQRAQVRLLRAGALADQVVGEQITYDHVRDVFEVQGQAAGTAPGTAPGNGRVRGTVTPRSAATDGGTPVRTESGR